MAFLFFHDYYSLRLWDVSPDKLRLVRELNFNPVLRTMANVTEEIRILDVVANTRFDTIPIRWRNSGEFDSGSVGRVGPDADYLHNKIHFNRALTENEAYQFVQWAQDQVPKGHPRGWNYDSIPYDWVGNDHIINQLVDTDTSSWAGDLPTVSHALEGRKCAGGAPNSGTMAVTPPIGVGPSEFGTPDDVSVSATQTDLMIVPEFLGDVCLRADSIDNYSWSEIRGYLRGRLNL